MAREARFVSEISQKTEFEQLAGLAQSTIEKLVKKKALSVISINKEKGNWEVVIEVLERAAVPDTMDLIGKYLLSFGRDKELLGYKRIELKKKGQIEKEEAREELEQTIKK